MPAEDKNFGSFLLWLLFGGHDFHRYEILWRTFSGLHTYVLLQFHPQRMSHPQLL